MAKRKRLQRADDYFRDDMHKCYHWCIHNGVKIYPVVESVDKGTKYKPEHIATGEISICVENNGMKTISPKKYTQKEVTKKIWEIYCYMYDKNH